VPVIPEAEQAQELVQLAFEGDALNAAQTADELEVFAPGEVGIQVRFLGDVADAALKAGERSDR